MFSQISYFTKNTFLSDQSSAENIEFEMIRKHLDIKEFLDFSTSLFNCENYTQKSNLINLLNLFQY